MDRSGSGGLGPSSSGSRARRAPSNPLPLPGASSNLAHSFPEDDAGLLRKLLKRRSAAVGQPPQVPLSSAQLRKNRDKLVALLEEGQLSQLAEPVQHSPQESGLLGELEVPPMAVEEQAIPVGRITIHCTANSYDLTGLREHLEQRGHSCSDFPEALYTRYVRHTGEVAGDVCLFNFGVTCFWNLTPDQERSLLEQLKPFEEGKLSSAKVESDTFAFRLVPYAKPSIQNDLITLSSTMAEAHIMKLSISFALAQSTKLSVLEERALSIAEVTRKLPIALAREGKVRISDKAVAKLMGRVFIEQAALNLLGSVLDTPDLFWERGVGDHMQSVYDKVFEYLEMDDRIAVLNARLQVLHELLDMLRLQGVAQHSDFLEVIIIALICIDVVILLLQVAATLGFLGFGEGELPPGLRGVGVVMAVMGKNFV